jgi:two-component system, NtrC family, C4-dicarboxylate transport sensor histidine kinase DctB
LLKNSIDAYKKNSISSRKIVIKLDEITIEDKKYSTIKITDNAGGINQEQEERIFEPYFTTKHSSSGTGLGLFMSRMIIEQSLNGEMTLSNEDNGCSFIITIPVDEPNHE